MCSHHLPAVRAVTGSKPEQGPGPRPWRVGVNGLVRACPQAPGPVDDETRSCGVGCRRRTARRRARRCTSIRCDPGRPEAVRVEPGRLAGHHQGRANVRKLNQQRSRDAISSIQCPGHHDHDGVRCEYLKLIFALEFNLKSDFIILTS